MTELFPKSQFINPNLRAIHTSESPSETTHDHLKDASDPKVSTKRRNQLEHTIVPHHKDTPRRAYSLEDCDINRVITPNKANIIISQGNTAPNFVS